MQGQRRSLTKVEAVFLVPLREDVKVGNGELHSNVRWKHFYDEIYNRFGDMTKAPGIYEGTYTDLKNHRVRDESIKFIIAVDKKDSRKIISFIKQFVGPLFRQRSIYCNIGGRVTLVDSKIKNVHKLP